MSVGLYFKNMYICLVDKGGREVKNTVGGRASESGGSRKVPEKVPGTQEIP